MLIKMNIYKSLISAFPTVPPEAGAVIGADNHGIVSTFVYDSGTPCYEMAQYMPNVGHLNRIIQAWQSEGIYFCGIAHSHPSGQFELSLSDISTIHAIIKSMPNSIHRLYFPLVFPGERIISYLAVISEDRKVLISPDYIELVD